MAKAQVVHNLRCDQDAATEGRKVLRVRLDEVVSNRDRVVDDDDSVAIHDLRISAKRLRYSLETFAFCFPNVDVDGLADEVRALQDLLGRIHDLDVMVEILLERVTRLDSEARVEALAVIHRDTGSEEHEEALRRLVDSQDDRQRRLGLYQVIAAKLSERRQKYGGFETLWREWEQNGLLRRIAALLDADEAGARATHS